MADLFTGLGEVNVVCTNVESSLAFYRDVLGMRVAGWEDGAVHLVLGDARLLLLPFASRPVGAHAYLDEATFSIDIMTPDLKAASDHLRANGAKFEREHTPGARSVVVRDPDGLVIEVIQTH